MNLKNLFGKDGGEKPDTRRSGLDRRSRELPKKPEQAVTQERRAIPERRELLKDTEKIVEQYGRLPLFKHLTPQQIMKMLRICAKKKFPAAHSVYSSGEESRDMLVLLKGTMKVVLSIGEVWVTLKPPGTVGEMGLFTGEPRSADVMTETECLVLRITRTELFRVFDTDKDLHAKLLLNVVNDLAAKLRNDQGEIANLHYRLRALDQI